MSDPASCEPAAPPPSPARVLVLSQCAFGDTVVLIPALRALRRAWPGAHLAFLSEPGLAGVRVAAADVLADTGLVDEFGSLSAEPSRAARLLNRVRLALRLRRTPWDVGIVLVPPVPPLTPALVRRLGRYLRLFGARRVVAPERVLGFVRGASGSLEPLPQVSLTLLDLLQRHGVPVAGAFDPPVLLPAAPPGSPARAAADALVPDRGPGRHGALRLAVAPGAQMPAKRWPLRRYAEVLRRLSAEVSPDVILLGGTADREACDELARTIPGAVCVIGRPVPTVAEVMRRCDAYLGNDTGLMHLAAALGKPCVAVFSSRDAPGAWYPFGAGHTVLRTAIPCEGCLAAVCPRGDTACLDRIGAEAVTAACLALCRSLQAGRGDALRRA